VILVTARFPDSYYYIEKVVGGMFLKFYACIIVSAILFPVGLPFTEDVSAGSKEEITFYPPPRILSSPLFPCSNCHGGMETNLQKRQLTFHDDIAIKGHGEPKRWCLDCHDAENRDRLKLVNGDRVGFPESYLLCDQCHGNMLKHWKAGVHGKRVGNWDGEKRVMLCTGCHNPHRPRFQPLTPEPVPLRPEKTLRR